MDSSTTKRIGPASLQAMCLKAAMRNVRHVWDFGNLPIELIRPILAKVSNAEQLHHLEMSSPEIADETAVIWHELLKKKFMFLYQQEEPTPGLNYYEVYRSLDTIHKKRDAEATAELKARFSAHEKEKDDKTVSIVSQANLPRLPGRRRRGFGFGTTGSSAPAKTGGGRIMQQVRQEVRNYQKTTKLVTATGSLPVKAGQIKEAPKAMINDQRIAQNPAIKIQAPKPKKPRTERDEKESRLLAIKNKASRKSSEPAEKPYGGLEDLFGELEEPARSKKRSRDDLDDLAERIVSYGAKRARVELTPEDLDQPPPKPKKGLTRAPRPRLSPDRSPAAKKSTGLLSNKHGATPQPALRRSSAATGSGSTTSTTAAPPKQSADTSTARKPAAASPSGSPTRSPPPGLRAAAAGTPRKKKPVDIFMRPKKKVVR